MKEGDKKSDQEEAGWKYSPGNDASQHSPEEPEATDSKSPKTSDDKNAIKWTASEFVEHEKGLGWFAVLALVVLVLVAGLYFFTRDIFSTSAVAVMAIIFGVAASHKPRTIEYRLDSSGLTAGNKFYPYSNFKSFVIPEGEPFTSIMLVPMKRLSLPVGAFIAPEVQKEALELLSTHLPLERGEPGPVDTLMRRLRF